MLFYIYEDRLVEQLAPLTLSRPAFDLWCGSQSLLDHQLRVVGEREVRLFVRPELAPQCGLLHPGLSVNEHAPSGPVVLMNGRWIPDTNAIPQGPCVGLLGGQIAFAILNDSQAVLQAEDITIALEDFSKNVPAVTAAGAMIDRPWDLLCCNAKVLADDFAAVPIPSCPGGKGIDVRGPIERLRVSPWASVEPCVVADTRDGPVWIDIGARIEAFSRLEGPCYIGTNCHVRGARIRNSSIGPECRVAGEIDSSIIQGFANKTHDGFLGHSYVGSWVNLGAGTQVSNLRNDLTPIRMRCGGTRIESGQLKLGAFIADYTRTGVGTLLNCGSSVGPFCHLLPSHGLLPNNIPSFCEWRNAELRERTDFRLMFGAAATAHARRGQDWTPSHTDFFLQLYRRTVPERRALVYPKAFPPLRAG
jgi:UDP-N-acetylglucosamine diphosphorylase/glucosamine-1-phosphate N-acetyltransferase